MDTVVDLVNRLKSQLADLSATADAIQAAMPSPAAPLRFADFTHLGTFKLPEVDGQLSRFAYMDRSPMAFCATGDNGKGSLYLRGHTWWQYISEVTIPDAGGTAVQLQPFGNIAPGHYKRSDGSGNVLDEVSGLLVATIPGRTTPNLLWTVRQFYHVNPTDYDSHGLSSLNLAAPEPHGLWNPEGNNNAVAGYLATVPKGFSEKYLGGKWLLTGVQDVCGIGSGSFGPSVYATSISDPLPPDSSGLTGGAVLPATPLVWYPSNHPYPNWTLASGVTGVQWIDTGTKQALVFAVDLGCGEVWYGGNPSPGGVTDTLDDSKGYHAERYETQLWFYSIDDLQKVAAGQMQPWDIRPYETANITPLLTRAERQSGPIAWDPAGKRLFYAELHGTRDRGGYEPMPLIHVFQVQ